jgi:hypothetical protein
MRNALLLMHDCIFIFPLVLFSLHDTGMKADSPNKDISAKDIVSSIISAANRKMQKAKSRKGGRGSGSGAAVEDGREASGDVKENADTKQVTDVRAYVLVTVCGDRCVSF